MPKKEKIALCTTCKKNPQTNRWLCESCYSDYLKDVHQIMPAILLGHAIRNPVNNTVDELVKRGYSWEDILAGIIQAAKSEAAMVNLKLRYPDTYQRIVMPEKK